MTQDEIIEMARQAGGVEVDKDDPQCSIGKIAFDLEELEAFANLVAEREREECAMTAENTSVYDRYSPEDTIADAIRARGQA